MLESYIRSDKLLDKHIKSFIHLKNTNVIQFEKPNEHLLFLTDMSKSVNVDKLLLNIEDPYWFLINKQYNEVPAYIAHYAFQSYKTYLDRKVKIPRDDTGLFRDLILENDFHMMFNDIENYSIKDKYDKLNKNQIDIFQNLFDKKKNHNKKIFLALLYKYNNAKKK
jgi:hypothetical protein